MGGHARDRFPILPGFTPVFAYITGFRNNAENQVSGNHYHLKKQELFSPLLGRFEITLEDIYSKEREVIELVRDEENHKNPFLHIPVNIAHKVKCLEETGLLLVQANTPSDYSDEFPYEIK